MSRLPVMAQVTSSSQAVATQPRIIQSRMKAMVRAPGPASTSPTSMPVALGTVSTGAEAGEKAVTASGFARVMAAGRVSRSPSLLFLGELLGLVFVLQRRQQLVDLALHDVAELVEREIDAVVGHATLREVVGADAFGTVAGAHLQLAIARHSTVAFLLLGRAECCLHERRGARPSAVSRAAG